MGSTSRLKLDGGIVNRLAAGGGVRFVSALHAIWRAWKDGTRLRFEGEFYTREIMTPMFTPEPQPYSAQRIFIAAVGAAMIECRRPARVSALLKEFRQ